MHLFRTLLFRLVAGLAGIVLAPLAVHGQQTIIATAGQVGVSYTYQVNSNAAAPLSYGAVGLPVGLSINASTGVISGTPASAGTFVGNVSVTSGGNTNNAAISIAIAAAANTAVITSATTATGTVGTVFSYTATASNTPTSFNISGLPAGLSANPATGVISGTPSAVGASSLTLSANNAGGTGAPVTLTLTVSAPAAAPAITSAATASAAISAISTFTYTITATPAATSFTASGLPLGLSLDPATGTITGRPSVAGTYSVLLTAANAGGTSAPFTLTLAVGALSAITSAASDTAAVGFAYTYSVTADNAAASYNISGLPAGLSATGAVISGTPTATGIYAVSLSANNLTGTGPVTTLTLAVGERPVITSAATAAGTAGTAFTFTASASFTPTSYAATGLPAGLSLNAGSGLISGTPSSAGTASVSLTATNAFGTGSASTLTLTIAAAPGAGGGGGGSGGGGFAGGGGAVLTGTPPTVTTQPAAQTVAEGGSVSFTVAATGTGPLFYQWRKALTILTGATSATLTLSGVKAADAGTYSVLISNSAGAVASSDAVLSVTVPPAPPPPATLPVITTLPVVQTVGVGGRLSLGVAATGTAPFTYQWKRDGTALAGATAATFTLADVQPSAAGVYSVTVSNAAGSATATMATITVPSSRLANLSVRSAAGTGDQTLIVGFALRGSGSKPVLVRGIGPGLTQFGLAGALPDPQLRLFNGAGFQTNLNDDWGGGAGLAGAFAAVGAFALPATSKDAALLVALNAGAYTAQIISTAGTGTALVEAYDAEATATPVRLVNLSARTQVGTGDDVLIIGFVVTGNGPTTVLLRAVGPGLAQFGVGGVLTDPQLRLFAAGSETALHVNDNWDSGLAPTFAATGAFALPVSSKDAALLVTLQPGAYTAVVSGVNNATGVALVEVYEVP